MEHEIKVVRNGPQLKPGAGGKSQFSNTLKFRVCFYTLKWSGSTF